METPYIAIINGPNLNLLGRRQPEIYGIRTLDDIIVDLVTRFPQIAFRHYCHQGEGELIEAIQKTGFDSDCRGIVLNAGAYTHTSLAIADAIAAVPAPVVEVHLSNIFAREEIRHRSLIAAVCKGSISGFGYRSYHLAVEALLDALPKPDPVDVIFK